MNTKEAQYNPFNGDGGNINKDKREVPQISPETNISQDYFNQINAVVSFYKMRGGIERVKDFLKDSATPFHMDTYEEAYSDCKDVVNGKNKDSVNKLNKLAITMNEILKDPDSIDESAFRQTYNEICFLIYGNKDTFI